MDTMQTDNWKMIDIFGWKFHDEGFVFGKEQSYRINKEFVLKVSSLPGARNPNVLWANV